MNLTDLKNYWEEVATNNKTIAHSPTEKHFTRYTVEEVLNGLKSTIKSPLLAVELPEVRLQDFLSDNERVAPSGGVLVLKKVNTNDGVDAVHTAMEEMYNLSIQIITKIRNDRKKTLSQQAVYPATLIKHLDINSISMVEVGPVFQNHYGWRINYQLNAPVNLDLNESEWYNETKWHL